MGRAVSALGGYVEADDDGFVRINIAEILFKPFELGLGDGARVVVTAVDTTVENVVEHYEVAVSDISGVVCRAEGIAEILITFGVVLIPSL